MIKKISFSARRILFADLLILLLVFYIPALSHFFSFPLYILEPMRLVLLLSLLILSDKRNAYYMALIIPLFSFLVSGHPLLPKAIIMSIELFLNVFAFFQLSKKMNLGLAMFLAILSSKICFYGLKYCLVSWGILSTSIVETNVSLQIVVALIISLTFLFYTSNSDNQTSIR